MARFKKPLTNPPYRGSGFVGNTSDSGNEYPQHQNSSTYYKEEIFLHGRRLRMICGFISMVPGVYAHVYVLS